MIQKQILLKLICIVLPVTGCLVYLYFPVELECDPTSHQKSVALQVHAVQSSEGLHHAPLSAQDALPAVNEYCKNQI